MELPGRFDFISPQFPPSFFPAAPMDFLIPALTSPLPGGNEGIIPSMLGSRKILRSSGENLENLFGKWISCLAPGKVNWWISFPTWKSSPHIPGYLLMLIFPSSALEGKGRTGTNFSYGQGRGSGDRRKRNQLFPRNILEKSSLDYVGRLTWECSRRNPREELG